MANLFRKLSVVTLLFFSQFAYATTRNDQIAKTFDFNIANYGEAKANKNFLKFDMNTTFLFFFDKTVTGYAKNMNVTADFVDSQLRNAAVTIAVQSLDTNSEDRDRKMLEETFNAQTFPNIIVRFGAPIQMNGARARVAGSIEIRGSSRPLEVNFVTKETHDAYIIDGEAETSIKTLSLPDPSTFFTKVHDKITFQFHFDVLKEAIKNAKTEAEKTKIDAEKEKAESEKTKE